MTVPNPHFLLFSEARLAGRSGAKVADSKWRFVLEAVDGSDRLEAADAEPAVTGQRLELLAVIRGLEALEQPSRVTLVTPSRYVVHGLRFGMTQWKENDWQWERYGELAPIKHQDLWQRLDQALTIHQVECRNWDSSPSTDLDYEANSQESNSPAALIHVEKPRKNDAQPSLPTAVRTRTKRRNLRVDQPHRGPRSSAPTGWWGGILRWMRRTATNA